MWDSARTLHVDRKILTSWDVVPVGSVDDVVVFEEVLVVARPPVRVGHRLVKPRRAQLLKWPFIGDESLLMILSLSTRV